MRAQSPSRDPNAPYASFSTESPSRKSYQYGTPMSIHPVSRPSYIRYVVAVTTFVFFMVIGTVMMKGSTSTNNLTTGGSIDVFGVFGATEKYSNGWIYTIAGTGTPGYNGDDMLGEKAELNYPGAVVIDETVNGYNENAVYIADTRNNRIRYMSGEDGTITTFCGTGTAGYNGNDISATSAELSGPEGITLDDAGNIYIADTGNQMIRMVKSGDKKIYLIAGTGSKGYSGDGGDASSATFNNPIGLALDGGHIFIADSKNNVIRRIDGRTYIISTFAGTGVEGYSGDEGPATAATFYHPRGLFLETFEATTYPHLYVADSLNHVIRKIARSSETSGTVSTFVGTGVGGYNGDGLKTTKTQLYRPEGITVDDYGTYFISDSENYRIRAFSYEDSVVYTYGGDGESGTVVPTTSGVIATTFSLGQPRGIGVDSDNNVIIADEGLNALLSIENTPTSAPSPAPSKTSPPSRAPTTTRAPSPAPSKTSTPSH